MTEDELMLVSHVSPSAPGRDGRAVYLGLHIHLRPRYPGTPREFWWERLDEWPAARGGEPQIAALVRELRGRLEFPGR